MSPTTRTSRLRAFTLVEVVAALTIGSLIVVSVVSATRALSGARDGVDHRITRAASARRAMEAVVAALRNVRRDPIRDQPVIVGHSGGRGVGKDRINLLLISDTPVRTDGPESDQYEMSFYLAKPSGQHLPSLMCRKDHGLDQHPDDGGIATVVAEGIVGLSFEYYSDGEWSEEWPKTEPRTPEAVRVTVTAIDPQAADARVRPDPCILSTVVRIRVNTPTEPPSPEPMQKPKGNRPSGGPQR